jgi:hypothetical protein
MELKIHRLHEKLNNLGVQLPDSQRGIIHNLNLNSNRSHLSITESVLKHISSNV